MIPPLKGASIARVAIASPGDVSKERDIIERTIYRWNQANSESTGVSFLTLRWERDVVPSLADEDPQAIINRAIVERAHCMFAIFNSRLGSATPRSISGTVEEIEGARSRGLTPHVLFSSKAIPVNHDAKQLADLLAYRQSLLNRGVLATFKSPTELSELVDRSLHQDAAKLCADRDLFQPEVGTAVRMSVDIPVNGAYCNLRAENTGRKAIEDFEVTRVERAGRTIAGVLDLKAKATLSPGDSRTFRISSKAAVGDTFDVELRASHDGVISGSKIRLHARQKPPTPA